MNSASIGFHRSAGGLLPDLVKKSLLISPPISAEGMVYFYHIGDRAQTGAECIAVFCNRMCDEYRKMEAVMYTGNKAGEVISFGARNHNFSKVV